MIYSFIIKSLLLRRYYLMIESWRKLLYSNLKSLDNKNIRFEYYRLLEKEQWSDINHIKLQQSQNIKKIIKYSLKHVPYYRDIFRRYHIKPEESNSPLSYFHTIPLLEKTTLQKEFKKLQSDTLETFKYFKNASGGSTGEPVKFIQDGDFFEWGQAVKHLFNTWSGYSFGDRQVRLWGSERDTFAGNKTIKTRIGRWLKNEIWLNAYKMTPDQMRTYVQKINEFGPTQIIAYAESIHELSHFIKDNCLRVNPPKCIMTSAGTLDKHMRENIESTFKAPVFNRYGSREVGDIACECNHHMGLHISPLTHYIEILREDGTHTEEDETGEIIITSLTNFSMPLIRYRIGDMGSWSKEKCDCGRNWPTVKEIAGRTSDAFYKRDGTYIHGAFCNRLFWQRDWVRKYQVVQEEQNKMSILIAPLKGTASPLQTYEKDLNDITRKIKHVMGNECIVNFSIVEDIQPTSSGKYRYSISKVKR